MMASATDALPNTWDEWTRGSKIHWHYHVVWRVAVQRAASTAEELPTPNIKHQGQASGSPNYIWAGIIQVGQKIMTCFAQWVIYSDIMQILAWFFNQTWPKQFLKPECTLCWSVLFSCVPVWAVLLYRCDVMSYSDWMWHLLSTVLQFCSTTSTILCLS